MHPGDRLRRRRERGELPRRVAPSVSGLGAAGRIFSLFSAANAIGQETVDGGFRIVAPAEYAGARLADKAAVVADSDIETGEKFEGCRSSVIGGR